MGCCGSPNLSSIPSLPCPFQGGRKGSYFGGQIRLCWSEEEFISGTQSLSLEWGSWRFLSVYHLLPRCLWNEAIPLDYLCHLIVLSREMPLFLHEKILEISTLLSLFVPAPALYPDPPSALFIWKLSDFVCPASSPYEPDAWRPANEISYKQWNWDDPKKMSAVPQNTQLSPFNTWLPEKVIETFGENLPILSPLRLSSYFEIEHLHCPTSRAGDKELISYFLRSSENGV